MTGLAGGSQWFNKRPVQQFPGFRPCLKESNFANHFAVLMQLHREHQLYFPVLGGQ